MNQIISNFRNRATVNICRLILISLIACNPNPSQKPSATTEAAVVQTPVFAGDSALSFVDKQVSFGPRVPGTPAQTACADWLAGKFRSFGADVTVQQATVKVYDGTSVPMKNIIARHQPEKSNRILLMAHWDSRPFADQDPDSARRDLPIAGANDGGSGVGVLLEMVGAPNAVFTLEEVSLFYAQSVVDKVWTAGNNLGYGKFFSYQKTPQLIDDHRFINQIIGIPSIDIIQNDASTDSGFGSFWHTQSDNMSNVSRETLTAVGQTVLRVIYSEK